MTRAARTLPLVAMTALLLVGPARAQEPVETVRERVSLRGRGAPLSVEVHRPKLASGSLPTVMVICGWGLTTVEYQSIAKELAGRGFVAVLYQHGLGPIELDPKAYARGVSATLDALEAAKPKTPALRHADLRTVGAVGHSIGGATAVTVAASDKRIKAGVAISPGSHLAFSHRASQAAPRVKAPMLVIGAGNDAVSPTKVFAEPLFRRLGSRRRMLIELKGANHFNFADVPLWMRMLIPTEWIPGFNATVSAAEQRGLTHRYTVAWLQRFLSRAGDARGLTDGSAARRDVERGLLSRAESTVKPAPAEGLPIPGSNTIGESVRERIANRDAAIEQVVQSEGKPRRGAGRALQEVGKTPVRRR